MPWKDLLKGDEYPKGCIPHIKSKLKSSNFSEDCLYLNIITPNIKKNQKLPVVLWIHGGGYSIGSGVLKNINEISNIFTKNNIIFVTIQYRLGPLGWIFIKNHNNTNNIQNLGFWDQAMALKFIYNEIKYFGGDKNKITIIGGSAGGASAGSLSISPITTHMIDKTIELSGSFLSKWSNFDVNILEGNSKQLIDRLLCTNNVLEETLKCLQNKSVKEILIVSEDIYKNYNTLQFGAFGPTISGEFFSNDIINSMKKSKNIISLTGLTSEEAGYFTILNKAKSINKMMLNNNTIIHLNENVLSRFIDEKILKDTFIIANSSIRKELVEKILNFYLYKNFNHKNKTNEKVFTTVYTKILSDVQFNLPIIKLATLRNTLRHNNYLYYFSYFNPNWYDKKVKEYLNASTHTSDYWYILGQPSTGPFISTKYFINLDKNISFSNNLPFLDMYLFWNELETQFNLNLFINNLN